MFITGKYVKIKFQKIKIITKIEQKRLFLLTFLVSFYGFLLAQAGLHSKYMIYFVFGSFFE